MKLKRVDDKPIVLHTKQKAKLKIKKKSKLGDKKRFSIRTRKFRYKDVRLEPGSIKMKHHNLKAAMKTGGRAVAKNLDGGEEVADSLHVATTIVSLMMDTARKGTVFAIYVLFATSFKVINWFDNFVDYYCLCDCFLYFNYASVGKRSFV